MLRLSRRLRLSTAMLLFATAPSFALNTAAIVSSVASPDCLEYRVVGICYWLYCTWTGCTVRTSVKVRHYVPDAVVSSYSNTGENPWIEVRAMSTPNPTMAPPTKTTKTIFQNSRMPMSSVIRVVRHSIALQQHRVISAKVQARRLCRIWSAHWIPSPGATTFPKWSTPKR